MDDQKKRRDRLLNILKILVTVAGVVFVAFTKVDYGQVFQTLLDMDWLPYLGGLALLLGGVLVRAYRWGVLLWALKVEVTWGRLVGLWFVGALYSMFLPTGVGGDAVKMYEVARDREQAAAAISSVVIDRFLGLLVLLALALLALILGPDLVGPAERALIIVIFALGVLAVVLLVQRTWIEALGHKLGIGRLLGRFKILTELYQSLHLYGGPALLRATLASLAFNLMLVLGNVLLGIAVGIHLPVWYYFLFIPIISVLLLIPSVGGLGVREGGYKFLFGQVVDENRALALGLAYLSTLIITALIGAVIYLVQSARAARKK